MSHNHTYEYVLSQVWNVTNIHGWVMSHNNESYHVQMRRRQRAQQLFVANLHSNCLSQIYKRPRKSLILRLMKRCYQMLIVILIMKRPYKRPIVPFALLIRRVLSHALCRQWYRDTLRPMKRSNKKPIVPDTLLTRLLFSDTEYKHAARETYAEEIL